MLSKIDELKQPMERRLNNMKAETEGYARQNDKFLSMCRLKMSGNQGHRKLKSQTTTPVKLSVTSNDHFQTMNAFTTESLNVKSNRDLDTPTISDTTPFDLD